MKYHKVQDIAEALLMLDQGRILILSRGKHYLQDPQKADESWNAYLPAELRDELRGLRPELFERDTKEKIEISDKLLRYPNDESSATLAGLTDPKMVQQNIFVPGGVQLPAAPIPTQLAESGTFIAPNEFILHDTARRILESVCVLEQLHTIKDTDRHELSFAFVGLDAKGNPALFDKHKDKGDTLLSLADLAVYLLIDRYMQFQKADETIISLNVEKTMIYTAYMNEKEKRKELEEALMLKMILKI